MMTREPLFRVETNTDFPFARSSRIPIACRPPSFYSEKVLS